MNALVADRLTKRFGGLVAVSDVSLSLAVGELHAVIGPNGAGKSTLTYLLSGEMAPTEGRIVLAGRDVTDLPAWRRARLGLGRSYQKTNVMRPLTVVENARLAAQAQAGGWLRSSRSGRDAAHRALARVGLEADAHRIAASLSHGQLRLLEIAMALATNPAVLLLDEPLAGLGPEESDRLAALLREIAAEHAVLLIEHDMDVVFAVADVLTVMVDGRVLEHGTPAAIRSSTAVRDAYLGHELA